MSDILPTRGQGQALPLQFYSTRIFLPTLCLMFLCSAACLVENKITHDEQQTQTTNNEQENERARRRMVESQIRARGIRDSRVLEAMRRVPRHRFVPASQSRFAYDDRPLPIGQSQTISQPYIVAYMTEAARVEPNDKVLEIGTGSGYQAAILGELAREVYTIEIIPELADSARRVLDELGYRNVQTRTGNGYAGWPERAPFDAIIVTAAPEQVPQALIEQLAVGGQMVIPVGRGEQEMIIITKTERGVVERRTIPVRFVPMTGSPTPQ